MKKAVLAALLGVMLAAPQANASIIETFSGSGSSGFLDPPSGEPWLLGGGAPAGDFGWGSPGVGAGLAVYTGTTPATDFEITFDTYNIDPAQIAVGSGAGCIGSAGGGTTFCGPNPFVGETPWIASFNPLAPHSIAFFAPTGVQLNSGQSYFVNVFLMNPTGAGAPPSISFNGAWTGVPEPGSFVLLGSGLLGVLGAWRKRRSAI